MAENEIDKEIKQMLSFENRDDDRVANLQSQVATLMEQVEKLTQQAAQVKSSVNIVQNEVHIAIAIGRASPTGDMEGQ
ncbi:unnamed protein product [Haemonchus placei]|uniref:V-SNARE coiled-coil homology domain-containing protein n=1 Tax=Haemonchus placei TaxID=6290 RepID=A0A0N4W8Y9_HAEPC|nr:unnamed protein product [Haemonchus placei]